MESCCGAREPSSCTPAHSPRLMCAASGAVTSGHWRSFFLRTRSSLECRHNSNGRLVDALGVASASSGLEKPRPIACGATAEAYAWSLNAYAPRFNEAATFNAKALMILMVLAFAPILALLFRARHRAAGAHVVFALHLYAFVLVLLCASIVIAQVDLMAGGDGLKSPRVDAFLSLSMCPACACTSILRSALLTPPAVPQGTPSPRYSRFRWRLCSLPIASRSS